MSRQKDHFGLKVRQSEALKYIRSLLPFLILYFVVLIFASGLIFKERSRVVQLNRELDSVYTQLQESKIKPLPNKAIPLTHNCYGIITKDVAESTLGWFMRWLDDIHTNNCDEATLFINSYGGSLNSAMEIALLIQDAGIPIHTVCLTRCDSAALLIFSKGTGQRMVSRYSLGLAHRPTSTDDDESTERLSKVYENFYSAFLYYFPENIRSEISAGKNAVLTGQELLNYGIATKMTGLSVSNESFDPSKFVEISLGLENKGASADNGVKEQFCHVTCKNTQDHVGFKSTSLTRELKKSMNNYCQEVCANH